MWDCIESLKILHSSYRNSTRVSCNSLEALKLESRCVRCHFPTGMYCIWQHSENTPNSICLRIYCQMKTCSIHSALASFNPPNSSVQFSSECLLETYGTFIQGPSALSAQSKMESHFYCKQTIDWVYRTAVKPEEVDILYGRLFLTRACFVLDTYCCTTHWRVAIVLGM